MIPDLVNGGIEFTGGLLLLLHSRQVLRDREVKGVSVPPMLFFLAWGFWNLFYYPHLGQWWSFAGGCFVVAANALWVALVLYYKGLRWPRSIRRAWWVAHFLSCCTSMFVKLLRWTLCRLGLHLPDRACTVKQNFYRSDDGVLEYTRTAEECAWCRKRFVLWDWHNAG